MGHRVQLIKTQLYHGLQHCSSELFSSHPQIALGLRSILELEDSRKSFEEKFMLNFSVIPNRQVR